MGSHNEDVTFEAAREELDAALSKAQPMTPDTIADSVVKGIQSAMGKFLGKAEGSKQSSAGAPRSDLDAEKDKRGNLVEDGKDPAENPKKSGQGYKDSRPYVAEKGKKHKESMGSDDHDDDDDDMDKAKKHHKSSMGKDSMGKGYSSMGKASMGGKPSYFKKKKKHMGKGYEESEDGVDATEFMEQMASAVEDIGERVHEMQKAIEHHTEGTQIIAELLADPEQTRLMSSMAKAIAYLVNENKEIKKALIEQATLTKSITMLPGSPRVAGLPLMKGLPESPEAAPGNGAQLNPADRDRLFKARVAGMISEDEARHARQTGDLSVLNKKV